MKQQTAILLTIPLSVAALVFFVQGFFAVQDYNAADGKLDMALPPEVKARTSKENLEAYASLEASVARMKQRAAISIAFCFVFSFASAAAIAVIWLWPSRRRSRRVRRFNPPDAGFRPYRRD